MIKINLEIHKMWDEDFKQITLPTISFFHHRIEKSCEIDIMFFIWNIEILIWKTDDK